MYKKKQLIKILTMVLIGILGFTIASGIFAYIYYSKIKTEKETLQTKIDSLNLVLETSTQYVYVATEDILPGTILSEDKVTIMAQYMSGSYNLITSDDFGKIVTQTINSGEVISRYAVSTDADFDSETKLIYFSEITLTDKMTQGDYVDIRIRYKNGEDYIILSKKRLEEISSDYISCYLALKEEELQLMASAITDVQKYNATIYSTLFIEDMQHEMVRTYIPAFNNSEIFLSIYTEDNINKRNELEKRQSEYVSK